MGSRRHGHRPVGQLMQALVDAYDGNTHRLLADVAGVLQASVAYVDRLTVEAHLERTLSDRDWAAIAGRLSPMAFDEHVGEAGSFRTNWIEDILAQSAVPGRTPSIAPPRAAAPTQRRA